MSRNRFLCSSVDKKAEILYQQLHNHSMEADKVPAAISQLDKMYRDILQIDINFYKHDQKMNPQSALNYDGVIEMLTTCLSTKSVDEDRLAKQSSMMPYVSHIKQYMRFQREKEGFLKVENHSGLRA